MSAERDVDPGSQHMQALAVANRIRLARAVTKREVTAGTLTLRSAMARDDTQTMTVAELLIAQRRWGRTRVRKFLAALPLAESKQVGALSERQKDALLACLEEKRPPNDVLSLRRYP